MPSYELDRLVLLLSADWFFPYWDLIGIFTNNKRKSLLSEGCREIVRQIMSTATRYWHTNFSEARVKETRAHKLGSRARIWARHDLGRTEESPVAVDDKRATRMRILLCVHVKWIE